jgi:hypothetical protein
MIFSNFSHNLALVSRTSNRCYSKTKSLIKHVITFLRELSALSCPTWRLGHKDAAGALTSAGAPLWTIRGCSPQHMHPL